MKKKELVTIRVLEGSYILPPKDVETCAKIFLLIEEYQKSINNKMLLGQFNSRTFNLHNKALNRCVRNLKKLLPHAI